MRLLVVDFDYFFPVPQDPEDPLAPLFAWAHFETPYYLLEAWEERALAFLLRGLPLPEVSGWEGFWERFAFAPGAVLYYADSNALAFHEAVRRGVEEVVLLDAHHDAGYRPLGEEPACDDWMVFYHRLGARLRVLYPPWRDPSREPEPRVPLLRAVDPGGPVQGTFHRAFLCRSGAFVPPWNDGAFLALLEACPLPKVALEPTPRRALDLEALRRRAREEAFGLWVLEGLKGRGPRRP
uniref:Arginase n=1 Tax=Thermus islandicus TaxID=540988 RepID=A0A7C2C3Y5_9DEIN